MDRLVLYLLVSLSAFSRVKYEQEVCRYFCEFCLREAARAAARERGERETAVYTADGLVRKFGLAEKLTRNEASKYERGVREPALSVLLKYARAASVNVDVLMDDELELPRAFGQTITRRKQHSKKKRSKK